MNERQIQQHASRLRAAGAVLEAKPHHLGGFHGTRAYPNGYTVSVVYAPGTYGYGKGLYELAVMRNNRCVYDTPITDDVLGNLHPEQVAKAMREVEELQPYSGKVTDGTL